MLHSYTLKPPLFTTIERTCTYVALFHKKVQSYCIINHFSSVLYYIIKKNPDVIFHTWVNNPAQELENISFHIDMEQRMITGRSIGLFV